MARKAIQLLDKFLHSVDETILADTKVGFALFPGDGTMAQGLVQADTAAVQSIALDDKTDIVLATPPGDVPQ